MSLLSSNLIEAAGSNFDLRYLQSNKHHLGCDSHNNSILLSTALARMTWERFNKSEQKITPANFPYDFNFITVIISGDIHLHIPLEHFKLGQGKHVWLYVFDCIQHTAVSNTFPKDLFPGCTYF